MGQKSAGKFLGWISGEDYAVFKSIDGNRLDLAAHVVKRQVDMEGCHGKIGFTSLKEAWENQDVVYTPPHQAEEVSAPSP